MISTNWNKLTAQQIGKCGELYAQMTFLSYGMDVYSPEVDDHAVDMVIRDKRKFFWEIQVKSLFKGDYAFVKKRMITDSDTGKVKKNYFVCLLRFVQQAEPEVYLFPGSEWDNPDGTLFVSRDYPDGKSEPEFGINMTGKSKQLLEKYRVTDELIEKYFG